MSPVIVIEHGVVKQSDVVLHWDTWEHKWLEFPPMLGTEKDRCTSLGSLKAWMLAYPQKGWDTALLHHRRGNLWLYGENSQDPVSQFYIPGPAFILEGSDVVSSEVVLIRHKDIDGYILTAWKEVDVSESTLEGLKRWMKESDKWRPDELKPTEVPNVYRHGATEFWISGAPGFTKIMRRQIRDGKPMNDWVPFGFQGEPFPKTLEEFKAWVVKYPAFGWNLAKLIQDKKNKCVWTHGDSELYFPDPATSEFADLAKGEQAIRLIRDVTCVCAIGCALAEGGKYVVEGEEDGLVRVKDDNGEVKSFLPERFDGPGMRTKPITFRAKNN